MANLNSYAKHMRNRLRKFLFGASEEPANECCKDSKKCCEKPSKKPPVKKKKT